MKGLRKEKNYLTAGDIYGLAKCSSAFPIWISESGRLYCKQRGSFIEGQNEKETIILGENELLGWYDTFYELIERIEKMPESIFENSKLKNRKKYIEILMEISEKLEDGTDIAFEEIDEKMDLEKLLGLSGLLRLISDISDIELKAEEAGFELKKVPYIGDETIIEVLDASIKNA